MCGVHGGRSTALWFGARGAQLIDVPTAWALDGQAGVLTFAQFAVAVATSNFIHCKPLTFFGRLGPLSREWAGLAGLAGAICGSGLLRVLAHLWQSPVLFSFTSPLPQLVANSQPHSGWLFRSCCTPIRTDNEPPG